MLVPHGDDGDALVDALAARTRATACGVMLTARIGASYAAGRARLASLGAACIAEGASGAGQATLWQTDAFTVLAQPLLLDEVFGPSTLVVRHADDAQLHALASALEGQLTVSVHGATAGDAALVRLLATKAGRVVFDQFPTGVEVNAATVHGGPYPATSDGRGTSVGTRAIERFTRLVAFQNAPPELLPPPLRD